MVYIYIYKQEFILWNEMRKIFWYFETPNWSTNFDQNVKPITIKQQ